MALYRKPPHATIRAVPLTDAMIEMCPNSHEIPNGWAHCRCGLVPLEGAEFCGCLDHKIERNAARPR